MSISQFNLNQKQIDILEECKRYRQDSEIQEWYREEQDAVKNFSDILNEAGFPDENLSEAQLDQMFSEMRRIVNNRALARNLYEANGLEKFNDGLKELLFGSSNIADRIDQFLDLQGVGKTTVSHFLLIHQPTKYPVVTEQQQSVLDIQPSQKREAENIAVLSNNIREPANYHKRTIQYLGELLIYSKIKEILDVPDYLLVNSILWKEYVRRTEGVEPEVPLASVSIEADLRSYLAKNPQVLGYGLSLVKEEYDTNEVGRMDLLLKDKKNGYVVVETKKGRSSDRVVGQILRYMGWVKKNLGGKVKGIIIAAEPDKRLEYSLLILPNVQVKYYQVKFELFDKPKT